MARTWDDEMLDALRAVGDPLADEVVAAYFADQDAGADGEVDHGALLGHLVRNVHLDPEAQHPAVAAYLADTQPWPAWADPQLVADASELFGEWGTHVFAALFGASLPMAYASDRGVQVLHLTARLRTDTKRRLNETAQFHIDVLGEGGLAPGAPGYDHVRHVRLMHAGARWLILNDPQVAKTADTSVSPRWDPAWGHPINQEDLLETLLTFTEIVFDVFDRTGYRYTPAQADAYLHTWCIVGSLLGIRDDLLPLSREDTNALLEAVHRRQIHPSQAGTEMTKALLDVARGPLPRWLEGLPGSSLRFYVGDEVADVLEVPKADWTRVVFAPTAKVSQLFSSGRLHWKGAQRLSAFWGRHLIKAMVDAERGGDRAGFQIPDHLADRWRIRRRRSG